MKGRKLVAIAALAALFASDATTVATAAAATAAQQSGVPVTREMLIGRWTDNGDCSDAVDFLPDGSFVTTSGARGTWSLDGARLTFRGNSTVSAQIDAPDRDTIRLTHDDGTQGGSTRCYTARRPVPALPRTVDDAIRISTPASRALLFGRWTDDGDCGNAITFLPDGRFQVPTGRGTWSLDGERLSFSGQSTVAARVRAVGNDRILLIHDNGSIGQSVRC